MKKNLLNILTILAVCSCFLMYACSSKKDNNSTPTGIGEEVNTNESNSSNDQTTDNNSVDNVLDIENSADSTATTSEISEQSKANILKEILSSYLPLIYENSGEDTYIDTIKNIIQTYKSLDKTSLEESLNKIKNEELSKDEISNLLKNSIKSFLDANNISMDSISLTDEDKANILNFVTNNKEKILEDLLKLNFNIDKTQFITSILNILNNN